MNEKHIVIIGGGFTGIATALALEKRHLPNTKIILLADRPHFEYHGALYRTVTGRSPLEVCIPLRDIFLGKKVEVLEDKVASIDKNAKTVHGSSGSRYHYDYLVLGMGSVTNYFGIEGLDKYSYGMKTVSEAIRLKQHITETLLTCKIDFASKTEQICDAHFVIIGAGATGVELSAEIAVYARQLAVEYGIDPSLVSVDLIEGAGKILPALPKKFTDRIEHHLRGVGVNIFLNRSIEKEEYESVYMKDMQMKARTVVWTAGVRANPLYEEMGLVVDKRGKAEVDGTLCAKGESNIFIGGDGANTKYSGMAQTALDHGKHIAGAIIAIESGRKPEMLTEKPPVYAIPSGPGWAGILWGDFAIYGTAGWMVRRLVDFIVFWNVLPPAKAIKVFRTSQSICDSCSVCSVEAPHTH
jgi:NADH dehydrogenase